jgi:hypothetical protein
LRYFHDNLSIGKHRVEGGVVAEQPTGTVESPAHGVAAAYDPAHLKHSAGRPISWVGTAVVIVGFVIGGIAFVPEPHWIPFWIGAAIAIIGCFILLFSKAMTTDWY